MDRSKLRWGELVAAAGGIVLVISVFVPAYSPSDNPNARVAGGVDVASIWQTHPILRFLLLAAAMAPLVLLYIVVRGHELSWPRGEMTAVIGLVATTLLFYVGVIDRPGEPSGEVGLSVGWIGAFLASIALVVGGAARAAESERRRKPPGVL